MIIRTVTSFFGKDALYAETEMSVPLHCRIDICPAEHESVEFINLYLYIEIIFSFQSKLPVHNHQCLRISQCISLSFESSKESLHRRVQHSSLELQTSLSPVKKMRSNNYLHTHSTMITINLRTQIN